MLGLKTKESEKFLNYFSVIQKTANSKRCVFFADTGDGRDFETDIYEGEDMSGWLIPVEKSEEFSKLWQKDDVSDDWSDYFCFAVWENDPELKIRFE